jgi:hypothetical protein
MSVGCNNDKIFGGCLECFEGLTFDKKVLCVRIQAQILLKFGEHFIIFIRGWFQYSGLSYRRPIIINLYSDLLIGSLFN